MCIETVMYYTWRIFIYWIQGHKETFEVLLAFSLLYIYILIILPVEEQREQSDFCFAFHSLVVCLVSSNETKFTLVCIFMIFKQRLENRMYDPFLTQFDYRCTIVVKRETPPSYGWIMFLCIKVVFVHFLL